MSTTKICLKGIAAIAIGGAASSLSAALADPSTFNLSLDGVKHLGGIAFVGALVAVAHLFQSSPLEPKPSTPATPEK